MTESQSPPNEADKLAATLAALEAERTKRLEGGAWTKGARPRLMSVPRDGETLQAAQQREVYRHLAEHPDAPKSVSGYDWFELEIIDPSPTVELPGEQFEQPCTHDVSPPPYRPPMPTPPPASAGRSLPPPRGQPDPRNCNIPPQIHSAEQRRTQNFQDDTWPKEGPIRYPRGNRGGW